MNAGLPIGYDEATRSVHARKCRGARLLVHVGSPASLNRLALAERFVRAEASRAELSEAAQESWAEMGLSACSCAREEARVLSLFARCLEADPASHAASSLLEFARELVLVGVPAHDVERELDVTLPAIAHEETEST